MTANGWFQILFFLLVILAITKPLGVFMARVFARERDFSRFDSASDRKAALCGHRCR